MTFRDTLDGAVRYWPLLAAGVGLIASVAIAADKILTLEESVKAQQTQAKDIQRIEVHQATLSAQQEAIRADIEDNSDALKANQAILLQILQKVQ
jgi:hypothetical protein